MYYAVIEGSVFYCLENLMKKKQLIVSLHDVHLIKR